MPLRAASTQPKAPEVAVVPELRAHRELLCPLCGLPNGCVPAHSGTFNQPCWCAELKFSTAVLAMIPQGQKPKACLCPACAQKETS